MMPRLNGYETLLRLRADDRWKHIPVIVVSALQERDMVTRCIESGAEDYLTRPFDRTLLQARIAASLEKKRLRDVEQRHLALLKRELTVGRFIQADFLPSRMPEVDGWEFAARLHPARDVTGDFYDAFPLPTTGLALVIADVCDKGVGAGLFMVLIRTLIRVFAELARPNALTARLEAPRTLQGALSAVQRTNDYLANNHTSTSMFASLFLGILEPASGRLAYVNAGHEPPIHLGVDGVRGRLASTGPAIGMHRGASFGCREITIARGEGLLAYTDGVPDARDPSRGFYTEDRLVARVDDASRLQLGVEAFLDHVLVDVEAHVGKQTAVDDLTLLLARRT
jgi:serine phosphatase RsbU (regulator of sigma subunit)